MTQAGLFEEKTGSLRPLRERQAKAIEAIREAVREGHRRIVVMAPTGFGKTIISAHLITGAIAKGKRPMFVVPSINLVNQTLKHFEREGIHDIGVIQAQHERTDWLAQTQIASVQTLIRRALPEVDFVIQDECHQIFDSFLKILDGDDWKDKIVIGLSATPWARGMGNHWTKLIIAATTQELINEGWLSPFKGYGPGKDADFGSIKVKAGEFVDSAASEVMSDAPIVADIVQTWLEKAKDLPTFMFCVDCAHARVMRDKFLDAGISCGYIDGTSTDDERKETFQRFRSGEDKIIASVGCLITGIDEDVRCIIDAQPTMSEIRHVQKIGRGLRTADGKISLLLLDHAGNNERLGKVTDIHHESLDNRKAGDKSKPFDKEKKTPKPKKCQVCYAIIPRMARKCPECGAAVVNICKTQSRDGELVEFGLTAKATPKPTRDEKQITYSHFLHIAQKHGLKPGFAAHRYREIYGVWPRGLNEVPVFDKHLAIKWAKGRKKAAG